MARAFAESQPFDDGVIVDPYLYLANIKAHLADHKPMTSDDESAWLICHALQEEIMNSSEGVSGFDMQAS